MPGRCGAGGWLLSWCKPGRVAQSVGRGVPSGKGGFERARYDSGCHWKAVAGAPENGKQVCGPANKRGLEINRAAANISLFQVSGTSRPRVIRASVVR